MSRPRLHELLVQVFETRNQSLLAELFTHDDFHAFMETHSLKISRKELSQAFTHTSFSHEFHVPNQEQLEFLGDSVLQMILTDELFKKFPEAKEGHLSKLRSAIVNENSLSVMANALRLGDLLIVGKGEFKKKLFEQNAVLADTFEALLAQIYRHHGLEFTRALVMKWVADFIPKAFDDNFLDHYDSKSKLQERVLAKYKKLPKYTSEPHGEMFEVSLWINDVIEARGVFPSKKTGEKELAQEVLKKELF